jgi:DNA-binding LacI/PurR family transcriptional regulator
MAHRAVDLLVGLINGEAAEAIVVKTEPKLILRESTGERSVVKRLTKSCSSA